MINIPIIFEDEYILAIDKPSGITVNRSENEKGDTVQDWVLLRPDFAKAPSSKQGFGGQVEEKSNSEFINRAGIVHRLDKETSGILLVAKDEKSFLRLQSQFKLRMTEKNYYALVHGRVETKELAINAPVGRLPWNRRKFGVNENGREAKTIFFVQEYYKDSEANWYSFIKVLPTTGRTHQIRIHLQHIHHPVVADKLYSGRKLYRESLKICPRLFLHAARLKFRHPRFQGIVDLESKLPQDLRTALAELQRLPL